MAGATAVSCTTVSHQTRDSRRSKNLSIEHHQVKNLKDNEDDCPNVSVVVIEWEL